MFKAMVVFCITHKLDAFHAKFNMGSKICFVHVLQLFFLYMQHVSRLIILSKKKLRSNDSLHWIETTYMHLFLTGTYIHVSFKTNGTNLPLRTNNAMNIFFKKLWLDWNLIESIWNTFMWFYILTGLLIVWSI